MAAVFATVTTIAHFGEVFLEPLRVRPAEPAPITLRLPRTRVRTRDIDTGHFGYAIHEGIVARGTTVAEGPFGTLVAQYEQERRPPSPNRVGAQWLIYFLAVLAAVTFMRRSNSAQASLLRVQVGLLALTLGTLVTAKAALLLTGLPAAIVPVAVVPLWGCLYVDRRTGLMVGLLVGTCASALAQHDPVATAVYVTAGLTGILAFRGRPRATSVLIGGVYAAVACAVVHVAIEEIYGGFVLEREIAQGWRGGTVSAAAGAAGASVLAFLLNPLVSRLFGIVSRSQLLNLSDLEQPLLQKMQNDAPGSWEHSRMMANLAEAAAASIHADALLTRVGAYYHDLGKSVQPQYFIENLLPGERSPHEELEPGVSADAIMAHVVEGVRILRDGGIPEAVVEFAYTHHGTSVIEFFWHKCKKSGNPKGLTAEAFRYPGMKPRTRETGILMLIDAIEAGARTVEPRTREKFEELVRRVIFTKLKQGQLDQSGLTLEDLRVVTNRIVESLCSAYHSRIRYPWQDEQEAQANKNADTSARDTTTGGSQTATGSHTVTGGQRQPEGARERNTPASVPPPPSATARQRAAASGPEGAAGGSRVPAPPGSRAPVPPASRVPTPPASRVGGSPASRPPNPPGSRAPAPPASHAQAPSQGIGNGHGSHIPRPPARPAETAEATAPSAAAPEGRVPADLSMDPSKASKARQSTPAPAPAPAPDGETLVGVPSPAPQHERTGATD